VHRCLALAEALRRLNARSFFLMAPAAGALPDVAGRGFPADSLGEIPRGERGDCATAIAMAEHRGCDTVIVDSYAAGASYLGEMRSAGLRVISISDEANGPSQAHMLINGGAHAGELGYRSAHGDTRFLLGLRYALLQSEFRDCPRREVSGSVDRVLLSIGGDDPRNLMPRLIKLLGSVLARGSALDVVVGPFFRNRDALERIAVVSHLNVRLILAPEHLKDLLTLADIALCAGGQTIYEVAATGTPAIAMDLFENQTAGVLAMAEVGAIVYGGGATDGQLPTELEPALERLVATHTHRQQLSATGRMHVDGHGALRVADEIAQFT
jgi:spore coat polysaccharide biosynthesis predicted glycosyltransferase SpsG